MREEADHNTQASTPVGQSHLIDITRCVYTEKLKCVFVDILLDGASSIDNIEITRDSGLKLGSVTYNNTDLLMSDGVLILDKNKARLIFIAQMDSPPPKICFYVHHNDKVVVKVDSIVDLFDRTVPAKTLDEAFFEVKDDLFTVGQNLFKSGFGNFSVIAYILFLRSVYQDTNIDLKKVATATQAISRQSLRFQAIRILRQFVPARLDPANSGQAAYHLCFDQLAALLVDAEEIRQICQEDILFNGLNFWSATNLGHCHYKNGELAAADAYYLFAAQAVHRLSGLNYRGNRGIMSWRGTDFVRLMNELPLENILERLPGRVFHFVPIQKSNAAIQAVHGMACDDVYFDYYAGTAFALSKKFADVPIVIHIHVINPSAGTRKTLDRLASEEPTCFSYSWEEVDSRYASRSYYASARFIVAPMLMKRYHAPLIITDIDAVIKQKWSQILESLSNADIAITTPYPDIKSRFVPWSLAAALVCLAPNDIGRRFAELVAKYIAATYDFEAKLDYNWVIDQVAIARAYDVINRDDDSTRVKVLKIKHYLTLADYFDGGKEKFRRVFQAEMPRAFSLEAVQEGTIPMNGSEDAIVPPSASEESASEESASEESASEESASEESAAKNDAHETSGHETSGKAGSSSAIPSRSGNKKPLFLFVWPINPKKLLNVDFNSYSYHQLEKYKYFSTYFSEKYDFRFFNQNDFDKGLPDCDWKNAVVLAHAPTRNKNDLPTAGIDNYRRFMLEARHLHLMHTGAVSEDRPSPEVAAIFQHAQYLFCWCGTYWYNRLLIEDRDNSVLPLVRGRVGHVEPAIAADMISFRPKFKPDSLSFLHVSNLIPRKKPHSIFTSLPETGKLFVASEIFGRELENYQLEYRDPQDGNVVFKFSTKLIGRFDPTNVHTLCATVTARGRTSEVNFNALGYVVNTDLRLAKYIEQNINYALLLSYQEGLSASVLEACARGILPCVNAQSGLCSPSAVYLGSDWIENRAILEGLRYMGEKEYLNRVTALRELMLERHAWSRVLKTMDDVFSAS